MGTRSDIIVQRADGKFARIYCHWDGYIDHNGRLLFTHYNDQAKAEAIVALGDMSSLGEEIGKKHDFEWRSKAKDPKSAKYKNLVKMCLYYGRDRGETGVDPKIGDSLSAVWPGPDTGTEFTYVYMDGKWGVGDPDEGSQALVDLADAIAAVDRGEEPLKTAVKAFGGNFVIGRRA